MRGTFHCKTIHCFIVLQREQKKREAWLARKEALVRPGHVLGRGGTSEKNLLRDVMEHEDGDECQQHMNNTEQNWIEPQYNALVQQRIERERESVQVQRRVSVLDLF
jgi:hypothetical protein